MSDLSHDWKRAPLGRLLLARLRAWWRGLEEPDPWPEAIDRAAREPEAIPVCHRCFLPLLYERSRWFCADCGAAVGPFNNILPFVRIFSLGEVARSGVARGARFTTLTACGYTLACYAQGWILFPFYFFRLGRNILRTGDPEAEEDPDSEEAAERRRLFGAALAYAAVLVAGTVAMFLPLPERHAPLPPGDAVEREVAYPL